MDFGFINITQESIFLSIILLCIGVIIEFAGFIILIRIFRKTENIINDVILKSSRYFILVGFMVLSITSLDVTSQSQPIAVFFSNLSSSQTQISIFIFLSTIFALRIGHNYFVELDKNQGVGRSTILKNAIYIIIFCIGILTLLQNYGISITPYLTALGVGGIAVALALQETMTSFISGVSLVASQKIRLGDYIRLESGEDGFVTDITWRNTTIKQLSNNYLIIPNQKLGSGIVTNYNFPQKEMSILIEVGVSYDSNLDKVEKITTQTAKKVLNSIEGGVKDFDPFIRFHTFGESSINFTVILRVKEFTSQYLVKHEFIKELTKEYKKNNIIIPFPIRTIINKGT